MPHFALVRGVTARVGHTHVFGGDQAHECREIELGGFRGWRC
jgi:hypothetical protein